MEAPGCRINSFTARDGAGRDSEDEIRTKRFGKWHIRIPSTDLMQRCIYGFLLCCRTSTATTTAMIARRISMMMKQTHRFLRAARADETALSVCCKLCNKSVRTLHGRGNGQSGTHPTSVSFSTFMAEVWIVSMVSSCCSTRILI